MIKGIFFDFDGVITLEKQGTPPMIAYIAKTTGLPTETVEKAYRRHNRALLMGEVAHSDMWQPFCKELETEIDYDILKGAFLNITLDQAVVGYIRELKEKYLIGMITDNKVDRIETIWKEKGLEELFDVMVISAQNLEVPGRMGFRTVYFDDEKRDLTELREILKEGK